MPHVQIRNVPPEVHRKLKARAAEQGLSLSDYLLKELRPIAELPTLEEWVERVRSEPLVRLKSRPADIIRRDRDTR